METKTKVIMGIAEAYDKKNTRITDKVEAILLPNKIELHPTLKEKLDTIGDTPMAETVLYKSIQEENTFSFKVKLFQKFDLDIDAFDLFETTEFMIEVTRKITDKVDNDGVFKTTESLKTIKLPRASQLESLMKMFTEEGMQVETVRTKMFEIAQVDATSLTDWEKDLVWDMYMAFVTANSNAITLRQVIDKTPFGKYLKN
jgi:hypothetical protein